MLLRDSLLTKCNSLFISSLFIVKSSIGGGAVNGPRFEYCTEFDFTGKTKRCHCVNGLYRRQDDYGVLRWNRRKFRHAIF